jgi:MFS family permease
MYVASNGYGYLSIPSFYPSLTTSFGVAKGTVPQAASIMTLLIAFLSPFIGLLLDKYNPRVVMTTGVIGLVLMQFYFTQITNFEQLRFFYAGYAVALCLGGIIPSMYMLNKWFDKQRGIAVGLFLNASSLGAAFFNPYIGGQLKQGLAWQEVSTNALYITLLLFLVPILLLKAQPSSDQKTSSGQFDSVIQGQEAQGLSLKQAIAMPSFWLLIVVTGGLWFCINGIIFHKDTILNDMKLDSKQAGFFGLIFFLCGMVGKLIFGFLSDRFNKIYIMMASIACILLGAILFKISLSNAGLLPIVAFVFGIGYSGSFTMIQLLIADFYRGKFYGTILGIFIMADTLAGTAGIFLLGSLRKDSGNYQSSFLVMILICLFSLAATFLIKKPSLQAV